MQLLKTKLGVLKKPEILFFDTDEHINLLDDAHLYLSKTEKEKSRKFVKTIDQQRYTIQRVLLRKELSKKLLIKPDEIQFEYSRYKKPFISNTQWRFNISHSKQVLMIGLIEDAEIGVDIEYIDYQNDLSALVSSVFTPKELMLYKQKNQKDQALYFYHIWTKKEAYSKAIGKGLNINFNSLDLLNTEENNFSSGTRDSFSWAFFTH
ncbi:4'-phosphopantetheinyl transferase family protein [Aquimarina sp. 2201CG5-10]|uniref:4'-phosphopantetheinyl transferase family protein n=1 Tax=Aquimarina callyspongiae TaxID=3098150 RepID=UPI002AB56F81|nr:4'-phosphopantetheinyl transferase superfamily protein [Aquimarina sp. 2201CG5-10]MDY8134876.1 4'-phosphopantetheinyl transferase superfamily protein [Aquimarina sp. 2201CG5-10]